MGLLVFARKTKFQSIVSLLDDTTTDAYKKTKDDILTSIQTHCGVDEKPPLLTTKVISMRVAFHQKSKIVNHINKIRKEI